MRAIVDLRSTSLGRLDSTLANHVLPQWGDTPLSAITNADVRAWVAQMSAAGMSASSVRKARGVEHLLSSDQIVG